MKQRLFRIDMQDTNRHRIEQYRTAKHVFPLFTPMELLVAEMLRYRLGNEGMAWLLGIKPQKVKVIRKRVLEKAECTNEDDLELFMELYLMGLKSRYRKID